MPSAAAAKCRYATPHPSGAPRSLTSASHLRRYRIKAGPRLCFPGWPCHPLPAQQFPDGILKVPTGAARPLNRRRPHFFLGRDRKGALGQVAILPRDPSRDNVAPPVVPQAVQPGKHAARHSSDGTPAWSHAHPGFGDPEVPLSPRSHAGLPVRGCASAAAMLSRRPHDSPHSVFWPPRPIPSLTSGA